MRFKHVNGLWYLSRAQTGSRELGQCKRELHQKVIETYVVHLSCVFHRWYCPILLDTWGGSFWSVFFNFGCWYYIFKIVYMWTFGKNYITSGVIKISNGLAVESQIKHKHSFPEGFKISDTSSETTVNKRTSFKHFASEFTLYSLHIQYFRQKSENNNERHSTIGLTYIL